MSIHIPPTTKEKAVSESGLIFLLLSKRTWLFRYMWSFNSRAEHLYRSLEVSRKIKDMEVKLSLLKKQLWMADEDEFSHLKSRITEVKRLTSKYKNHPYVDEFMREWMVMFSYGTYILEGEIDPNFSSSEIWSLIQDSEYKLSNSDKVI